MALSTEEFYPWNLKELSSYLNILADNESSEKNYNKILELALKAEEQRPGFILSENERNAWNELYKESMPYGTLTRDQIYKLLDKTQNEKGLYSFVLRISLLFILLLIFRKQRSDSTRDNFITQLSLDGLYSRITQENYKYKALFSRPSWVMEYCGKIFKSLSCFDEEVDEYGYHIYILRDWNGVEHKYDSEKKRDSRFEVLVSYVLPRFFFSDCSYWQNYNEILSRSEKLKTL